MHRGQIIPNRTVQLVLELSTAEVLLQQIVPHLWTDSSKAHVVKELIREGGGCRRRQSWCHQLSMLMRFCSLLVTRQGDHATDAAQVKVVKAYYSDVSSYITKWPTQLLLLCYCNAALVWSCQTAGSVLSSLPYITPYPNKSYHWNEWQRLWMLLLFCIALCWFV